MAWGDPWGHPWGGEQAVVCGTDNIGYGDPFDDIAGEKIPGGYGNHGAGYGHPCFIAAVGIVGGRKRHDLGGEKVTLVTDVGGIPEGPLAITVNGVDAYSGVMGQGNVVNPNSDRNRASFVMPALWGVTGDVDVVMVGVTTVTFTAALFVVQHPGRSGVLFVSSRCDPDVNLLPSYRPRV